MEENKTYKCSLCGSEHTSVKARAECELKCYKKQEDLAKAAAEQKKKAAEIASAAAVSKALDDAYDLLNKHMELYGYFKYNGKVGDLSSLNLDFFPTKLWHHFWH